MCLNHLEEFETTGIGYKYFNIEYNKLFTPFKGRAKSIPINIWVREKDYRTIYTNFLVTEIRERYKPGFHIYKNKRIVRSPILVQYKVEYRNVVATGMQSKDEPTIVAKEMKVLEEVKYEL